jgi:NIPSNAP
MITCYVRYLINPSKVVDFERYAKLWIPIVLRLGGTHHGYFLPHEGANNVALCLFSFPSLAMYEEYRQKIPLDTQAQAAIKFGDDTQCIVSYERTFLRPVLS